MNIRILALLLCGLTPFLSAQATDFSNHLPAGSLMVIQAVDIPTQQAISDQLPMNKAWEQIDWKRTVVAVYEKLLAEEEIDEDAPLPRSGAELRDLLDVLTTRLEDIETHFSGNAAFVVGDFQEAVELFRKHEVIRESAYSMDETSGEGLSSKAAEMAAQEDELEAAEMRAVFGEMVYYADVKDGSALLEKIEGWISEFLQKQQVDGLGIELRKLDWDGTPVYTLAPMEEDEDEDAIVYPSLWWTVTNDIWTISGTETALRQAIRDVSSPVANPLSSDAGYLETMAFLGRQDSSIYLNLPRLDPLIRAAIGEEALNEPTRPNAKTPAQFLDWLSLDALLPYAFGFRMDPETMQGTGRMGFSRETPISRILVEPTLEPAPLPPFLHKDFSQVSSMRWSIPRMIRQLEKELSALDPQAAMFFAMGKGFLSGQLGMDVQTQFLDHFGDGLIFVQEMDPEVMEKIMEANQNGDAQQVIALTQQHPTNGQNYLLGMEVGNLQAVSGGLNTLLSKAHPNGLPEPEMFRGHPVHNPMPENAGPAGSGLIRYTFLDNYLLLAVGNPTLLHKAISASGEPVDQLGNDPEFLALMDRFPKAQVFEYASGEQQAAAWDIIGTSLGGLMGDPANAPDFSAFADIISGSISVINRQGNTFEMQSVTTFTPPE